MDEAAGCLDKDTRRLVPCLRGTGHEHSYGSWLGPCPDLVEYLYWGESKWNIFLTTEYNHYRWISCFRSYVVICNQYNSFWWRYVGQSAGLMSLLCVYSWFSFWIEDDWSHRQGKGTNWRLIKWCHLVGETELYCHCVMLMHIHISARRSCYISSRRSLYPYVIMLASVAWTIYVRWYW